MLAVHDPVASGMTVATVVAPSKTVTFAAGSALPRMTMAAVRNAAPVDGLLIVGPAGAIVSTVTVVLVQGDTLPAASVAFALIACVPSPRDALVDQLPLLSATPVASTVDPSRSVSVAPASALAVTVIVDCVVSAGTVIDGAVGAVVSTSTSSGADAAEVLPATSDAVVVTTWAPSLKAVSDVVQAPVSSAVVSAATTSSFVTRTYARGSALPLTVSCALRVTVPST